MLRMVLLKLYNVRNCMTDEKGHISTMLVLGAAAAAGELADVDSSRVACKQECSWHAYIMTSYPTVQAAGKLLVRHGGQAFRLTVQRLPCTPQHMLQALPPQLTSNP